MPVDKTRMHRPLFRRDRNPMLAQVVGTCAGSCSSVQRGSCGLIVAALVAVFTAATLFAFDAPFAAPNQMTDFLKNLAISGGLLHVSAYAAGDFALHA